MRTQSNLGKISSATNASVFGVTFLALRMLMGILFISNGWSKIVSDWSAENYLLAANGPFAEWFHSLAGNGVVDVANAWGLFLLGVALILGVLIRPAALLGIVLMLFYYLSNFTENTAHGFIDEHWVYAAVLALFAAGGAGHAFGCNAMILGNTRKPNAVVRWIFG
jgi:uncharacterized membrane protein YphA (DoxX/SURF4 family)